MKIDFRNGKYFFYDNEIKTVDEDFFGHNDIAKTVCNIVESQPLPHTIAVVGSWGIGKTSVLELVKKEILNHKRNGKDFDICSVNAWQYENEVFRLLFLKKLWEHTEMQQSSTQKIKEEEPEKPINKEEIKKAGKWITKMIIPTISCFIIITIMFLLVSLLIYLFSSQVAENPYIAWVPNELTNENSFIVSREIISGLSRNIFLAALCPILLSFFANFKNANAGSDSNLETKEQTHKLDISDQYKKNIENWIAEGDGKNKILITIIDDIDRLSGDKIIEALNSIKTLSNIDNSVVIALFDENRIIDALSSNKNENSETSVMSCQLLIEKLFPYRVELVPFVRKDLIPYALNITKDTDLVDLVNSYGDRLFEDIIVPILIPNHIETPRQVKKILNKFSNDLLLTISRSEDAVPEIETRLNIIMDANIIKAIAKLSIIQTDFPSVYAGLFTNQNLFSDLLAEHEKNKIRVGETGINRISDKLKLNVHGNKYRDLIKFIESTKHIDISEKNLRSLLYKADSLSSLKSGGLEDEIHEAIISGQINEAFSYLSKIKKPVDYLQSELRERIMNITQSKQYALLSYHLYPLLDGDKTNLANAIADKTMFVYSSGLFDEKTTINMQQLLSIFLTISDDRKVKFDKFLVDVISSKSLKNDNNISMNEITGFLSLAFSNCNQLSDNAIKAVRSKLEELPIRYGDDVYDFGHIFLALNEEDITENMVNKLFPQDALEKISLIFYKSKDQNLAVEKSIQLLINRLNKEQNFEELSKKIYLILRKLRGYNLVKGFIKENISKISVEDKMAIVDAVAQIKFMPIEKDRYASEIMDFIIYVESDLEISIIEKLDDFMSKCFNYIDVVSSIEYIKKQGYIRKIPETLEMLMKSLPITDRYHGIIIDLYDFFDDVEKTKFSNILTNALDCEQKENITSRLVDFIINLTADNSILEATIAPVENQITKLYGNYQTKSYWANEIIKAIGHFINVINPAARNKYYTILEKISKKDSALALKAWHLLDPESESFDEANIIVESTLEINKADINYVYSVLQPRSHCLDSAEKRGKYQSWLITGLSSEELREESIDELQKTLPIVNIASFFQKTIVSEASLQDEMVFMLANSIRASEMNEPCLEILSDSKIYDEEVFAKWLNQYGIEANKKFFDFVLAKLEENYSTELISNAMLAFIPMIDKLKKTTILSYLSLLTDNISAKELDVNILDILTQCGKVMNSVANRNAFNAYLHELIYLTKDQDTADALMEIISGHRKMFSEETSGMSPIAQ